MLLLYSPDMVLKQKLQGCELVRYDINFSTKDQLLGPPRWPGLLRMGAPSPKANEPQGSAWGGGALPPLRRFAERVANEPQEPPVRLAHQHSHRLVKPYCFHR